MKMIRALFAAGLVFLAAGCGQSLDSAGASFEIDRSESGVHGVADEVAAKMHGGSSADAAVMTSVAPLGESVMTDGSLASTKRAGDADTDPSAIVPKSPLSGVPHMNAPAAVFPLEVLGDGGVVHGSLPLALASEGELPDRLYVLCHRCGFYGDPEWEATRASPPPVAASLRINGGAWVDVTDAKVRLFRHEASAAGKRGAVNGGAFTVRFEVLLTAQVVAGLKRLPAPGQDIDAALHVNTVEFRFNGTDGHSNGFRVLDARWLKGSFDVTANPAVNVDPLDDKRLIRSDSDVLAGKLLWETGDQLRKNGLVDRKIRASCRDCHTERGRDLQYFNYSDAAIVARSRFHGLTEQQGLQIAAYIRASNNVAVTGQPVLRTDRAPLPHVAAARPWNPPYQPGPGLDSRPAHEWAAGAGLAAVLDDDSGTLAAMFGSENPSQSAIDAVMDTTPGRDLNLRQLPVALQLPDWNAWLPSIHPKDMFGPNTREFNSKRSKPNGLFLDGPDNPGWAFRERYEDAFAALAAAYKTNGGDWAALSATARNTIYLKVIAFGAAWSAAQGTRGESRMHTRIASSELAKLAAVPVGASDDGNPSSPAPESLRPYRDRARLNMALYAATRQWELSNAFGLEGYQNAFLAVLPIPGLGEARGWIALDGGSGVFYAAPHIAGESGFNRLDWQLDTSQTDYKGLAARNTADSAYRTNQWYHLALVLDSSGRLRAQLGPFDYQYIVGFAIQQRAAMQAMGKVVPVTGRYVAYQVKWAQLVDNAIPMRVKSFGEWNRARSSAGWGLRKLSADSMLSADVALGAPPALQARLANGWVKMLASTYSQRKPDRFRRCTGDTPIPEVKSELYEWYAFCIDADTPLQRASRNVASGSGVAGDTRPSRPLPTSRSPGEIQLDGLIAFKKSTLPGIDPAASQPLEAWLKSLWPAIDTTLP